jgi:hypothetical protein
VAGHRNAAFEWESGESPVTYECSLDGAAFGFCDNRLYELSEGDHVYRVRATDQYGNVEDPPLQHRWRVEQPTPPNDDFADALTLVNGQAVTVNNGHATAEDGEPGHDPFYGTSLAPYHSVWFAFTAVGSSAELDFCQIDWPANWALYTGSSLASLARVAGNYTDENCKDSLSVTAGTTYHLAIDGQSRSDDLGTGPVTVILGKNAVAAEAPPTAGPPPAPEVTTDGPAREPAGRPTVGVTVELGAKARLVARTLKAPGKVACTGDATCRVVVRLERRKRVLAKHRWTVPAGEARTYSMRVGWRTRRQLCASSGSRVQVIARGGGTRVKRHAPLVCR